MSAAQGSPRLSVSFSTAAGDQSTHSHPPSLTHFLSKKSADIYRAPAQLGTLPESTWGSTSCISLFISWANAKEQSMCPHSLIQPGKLLSEVGGYYQSIKIRVLKTREVKPFTWGHTAEKKNNHSICHLVEVMKFQLSYFKSWKMMLWKCYTQYVSKFGKLSSGHRTGKGQFSFQSQRKAMPKNAQTTAQLHSSHTLVK